MDLSQTKLSKSEWASAEIPVSEQEKRILTLIMQGYYDPEIKINEHQSLLGYMRVDQTEEMDYLLYTKYFQPLIQHCGIVEKGSTNTSTLSAIAIWAKTVQTRKVKPPHKADIIRIQKADDTISSQRHSIFEFLLLDYAVWSLGKKVAGTMHTVLPQKALYTLLFLRKVSVSKLNQFVVRFIDHLIQNIDISSPSTVSQVFSRSADYIEKNAALMEYADQTLYSHQRDLFSIFSDRKKRNTPKLVLYIAPTGTGKTLSPLGLSQDYRVIFVCGARHVGLALAKSAISSGKRVAFAFGCTTASDIRLHYFAAADYTVNKHSGGIYKVDNSNGIRVEIMICDIASYLIAMYYMQSFHNEQDILTYWDEPTITMDYEDHPLHSVIHRAWSKNQISKVILSCATLPTANEIGGVIHDFRSKFYGHGQDEDGDEDEPKEAEIHIIHSHDCKKTISLMDKDGKLALPHLLFPNYGDLIACVDHCEQNKSLLRYMDISEIVRFCTAVQPQLSAQMRIDAKFEQIDKITLNSIKNYYLSVLKELPAENWHSIYQTYIDVMKPGDNNSGIRKIQSEIHPQSVFLPSNGSNGQPITRQSSVAAVPISVPVPVPITTNTSSGAGVLLTTADAHTLTDGPTIYLAEDVDKIGRFYIQQSKIPDSIFATIQQKIDRNNTIQQSIEKLEREQEVKMKLNATTLEKDYSRKAEKEPVSREMQQLLERIGTLRESIQTVHLSPMYIPNTKQHQDIWVPPRKGYVKNAFTPNVDERDVREIMGLDVSNQLKLLLILGIGVFSMHENIAYMEIMKRLANEQRLFLIIASSDYIYGTNYQFCHGFIGKDLTNMTQQKTIQAIGRIGRNNIQQEYTVRFRDNTVLQRLFTRMEHNREAEIMNRLFSTDEEDM